MTTLYYWPGLPGRGEIVRLLLAYGEMDYVDAARREGVQAVVEARERFPGYAPPYLELDGEVMSQTPVILRVLAERFEAMGDSPRLTESCVLTLFDLIGEVHQTHHPISTSLYYEDQKEDARRAAKAFLGERLPAYLDWIEKVGPCDPFWLGSFSYADLVLLQVLDGLVYAFPNAMDAQYAKRPKLLKLRGHIDALPAVRGHRQSIRHVPFTEDGLFRHYPELDS